mmetsp:Transcript_43448/g.68032  ORF Transcript_43448/g.68032 Transcript_43448/m.68032 type:complete len:278 (+) Transcript_43448:3-836(+)
MISATRLQKDARCTNSTLLAEMADANDEFTLASCSRNWFFFRTFLQALGESFVEDMQTDASIFVVVVLYTFMNLCLLNLLVAIMSNTYSGISQQSGRKFLLDLYAVSQYYVRISIVLPTPFNILSLGMDLIVFAWHMLNGDYQQLYGDNYKSTPLRKMLTKHLGRNVNTDQTVSRQKQSLTPEEQRTSHEHKQEDQRANKYKSDMDAFMENAKAAYIEKWALTKDTRQARVLKLQKEVHQKMDSLDNMVDQVRKAVDLRAELTSSAAVESRSQRCSS